MAPAIQTPFGGTHLPRTRQSDLDLPSIDPRLDVIRRAGRRSLAFAAIGVLVTASAGYEAATDTASQVLNGMGTAIPLENQKDLRLFALTIVGFASAFGGFAVFRPMVKDQLRGFLEQFDRVTAIARQITLADGIGDHNRRQQASDILWRARGWRKDAKDRVTVAVIWGLLLGSLPWFAVLCFSALQTQSTLAVAITAMIILAIKVAVAGSIIFTSDIEL